MKFRSSCCCWVMLLLVGSSVISVSPNSSTTATTIFQQQHHRQSSMHPAHIRGTQSRRDPLSKTITNKLKSLENYLFASTTMSLESVPTTQRSPVTVTSVQEQLLTLPSSSSPPTSRTTTAIITTTSSSSLSSSSAVSAETSSLDINSIKRWKRSHSIDGGTTAANISSVTGAMVHHHFSEQKTTTESYPSMFFQMNSESRSRWQTTRNRIPRDVEMNDDGGVDKCHKFVEGEPDQNIMYSPDYPNNYPKNINCTRIIEAPRGQLIRLDFRNSFSIEEKEDCKFDYLEIRDGPYGFSNLVGRFCGEEFPPMITSRERHLWLHFHSDESIEYSGFTAVYEFIDRPKEAISTELNCTIESTDDYEGYINSTDVPQYVLSNVTKYKIPLDCMWIIKVKENWKISVKFIHFNLIKPNDCDKNFIDIFGEDTNIPSRVKNFCGSTGEAVSSESNVLHIRFYAEQVAMNSSFKMLYTSFREKGTAQNCAADEYDCQDATCIWGGLLCNKRDNCKFRWDEEGCPEEGGGQSEHVTIIIVVFGLILGGMIVTFLVNCVRKIMRDQKIIREHIRQSRESKLDEMGRLSKARSKDNVSGVLSPRQKHSQTSLQILDDVSQRYYREVVPISVQTGKTDLKDHSILRNHHDMVVQTSLCADSSTPERAITGSGDSGGVCDMGCQTRESLFQPLARQKSITSSSPNQSTAAAIRFSTFGYDMPPPPPLGCGQKSGTLSRQSSTNIRQPSESIELEERLRTASHHSQHHHSHSHLHGGGGGGGSGGSLDPSQAPTMRPPQEMCHHHHQHQQHLQKHQMQQQQLQQQQPTNPGTMGSHQHQHHQAPPGGGKLGGGGKHHKHDETSKVFIDIRNSAPDVIIMTSH